MAGFIFLQPLAGMVLGATLLGEPLPASALVGGALILLGVHVLALEERRAEPG
jgi:drug/metabolite transporter (DMT)-like permease